MLNMAVLLLIMIKIRDIEPKSFSKVKFFPGTDGNPFDRVLHSMDRFENIPAIAFLIFLLSIAAFCDLFYLCFSVKGQIIRSAILFFFYLFDWLLISLLPLKGLSFGPAKPVVLILAILRFPFIFLPFWWNIAFELIGTLLVIIGFYIEPFHLEVHHETIPTTDPNKKNFRIVHLGDLHIERITKREEKIIKELKDLKPDLILFSGDILNLSYLHDGQAHHDARKFFKQLSAPLGVFAVSGSPAVDLPSLFPELLRDTQVQWLDNRVESIELENFSINIFGLTCSHNPDMDNLVLHELTSNFPIQKNSFNILLHHSPDIAPLACQYNFDLQLSGHTHGGQVCLPFFGALVTGSLYNKAFESGHYLVKKMNLYVTRGLGMEGAIAPRVRLFCRPEIIVWDL